jgi:hypothetical protein
MFPFDQPESTAFYLVWYMVTLVLHVLPMNYVLAGSTYLAVAGFGELCGRSFAAHRPIADKLRDWMPFALGVTITAGVAPILFVQILYKKAFYTANLLLFNRWMAILPVLIVAFYLLYVQKSKHWHDWPRKIRASISCGILVCFAFVAWSWTENHLLSLQSQERWTAEYLQGKWFFFDSELIPRLTVWYVGAFPMLAMALGWQFWIDDGSAAPPVVVRLLARVALFSSAGAALAAAGYYFALPDDLRTKLLMGSGRSYLALAAVGFGLQVAAWWRQWTGAALNRVWLAAAAVGMSVAVVGMTALRELRRIAAIDLSKLADSHSAVTHAGGFAVFFVFFLLNTLVIAGVVVLVSRELRNPAK